MSGDRTSLASTLPLWLLARGEGGTLRITCPRCGGKAVVNGKLWLGYKDDEGRGYIGRSCTYCFKTARISK
jgi:phage FluMu protein Com